MTYTVDPAVLRRAARRLEEEAGDLQACRAALDPPDAGALTPLVRLALTTCDDDIAEIERAFAANADALRYVARTAAETDHIAGVSLLQLGWPLWTS